ncbi:MAG: hypothetical protein IKT81_07380 [Clostridia bacterium]|nr:hypothetical protein [Clostridia bacterium]
MKTNTVRLIALLLCLCLCLVVGLVACKQKDKTEDDTAADGGQTQDGTIPDIFNNGDQGTTQPDNTEPPADDTPDIPPAPEVVRSQAYDTRVTADEIILHNGVQIGMSYDQVAAYSGYEGEKPADADTISIDWQNITYTFTADAEKGYKLTYVYVAEEAAQASIFRDIKIGDSLESVIGDNSKQVTGKIPAKDTELKKWAIQFLYGYEDTDPKGYADLRFIALSYYTVNVFTTDYVVNITFAREAMTVKWIEISAR